MAVAGVRLGSRIGPACGTLHASGRSPASGREFDGRRGVRLRPAMDARLPRKHSAAALPVAVRLSRRPGPVELAYVRRPRCQVRGVSGCRIAEPGRSSGAHGSPQRRPMARASCCARLMRVARSTRPWVADRLPSSIWRGITWTWRWKTSWPGASLFCLMLCRMRQRRCGLPSRSNERCRAGGRRALREGRRGCERESAS